MRFRRPIADEQVAVAGPGTRAIDRRVDRVDGGPEERRYRPRAPHRFSGGGPLREVTLHRVRNPDHWHLVTYGLSELDDKESEDPVLSGWGFELTFRLAVEPGAPEGETEPLWAVDLLTNLAAYVWSSGHGFSPGHHLDLSGPIRLDRQGDLTAALIVPDPQLGTIKGPYGIVEFLQVVAVTADELELCRSWSTDGVIQLLARRDALLITDLGRRSILADPGISAEVGDRSAHDGSALTELRVASASWRGRPLGRTVAQLGAGAAAALGPALRRELIGRGATFLVIGDHSDIRFSVADTPTWAAHETRLEVGVPLEEVDALAALFDGHTGWGRRPAWKGLRWRVVP